MNEAIQNLVEQTLKKISHRSFSARRPELGRMFKDPVCGRRHRGKPCEQVFAEVEGHVLENPVFSKPGKSIFKGKRLVPRLKSNKSYFSEDIAQQKHSRRINAGLANPGSRP
jgi:hypothetical protein